MSDALAVLYGLVLEDGRHWGEVAIDWQKADAAAVLDLDGPRLHFQTRPRGGSKTTDEAGVLLAVLLEQAPPATRSYAVAVDADQAALLHDAMVGFIQRTPGLSADLQVMARSVVNRRTQAALEVLPADGASAWGLRPHVVVVDELAAWPSTLNHIRLWEALVSSIPKGVPEGRARLVCLTTAGDPAHWTARVLDRAKVSAEWRASEMPGPLPWRRQSDLDEQRALLPESSYNRLHLNIWTAPEDRLSTIDAVRDCVKHAGVLPPEPGQRYVVALDVGLVNDATVVAVGHLRRRVDDGSMVVVVDRLDRFQGTKAKPVDLGMVEDHVAACSDIYNRAPAVVDPWQAKHLAQGLRRRGVSVREFTFSQSSTGRLGLTLDRLLRERLLELPDIAELVTELASVRLRETAPGNYRLDHDQGRHDDQAVAIALLASELLENRHRRRRAIVASGGVR